MNVENAKKLVKSIDLTDADKRSFETFQPLAGQMTKFAESGVTVVTVDTDQRTINERQVTEFHLAPADNDAAPLKMILAYNNRNIYVDGVSLKDIGEKDIDTAVGTLAAFKVDSVEMTGEYPMRRSKAAEALGFLPTKEFTSADWSALRAKYDSEESLRKAADSPVYDARDLFEIPKVNITAVA
jgi:hypothetical protein